MALQEGLFKIVGKLTCPFTVRGYAIGLGKKSKSSSENTIEKINLEVEKDTHKLVNYVCGTNLFEEGEDVKIKPDSEYPEWLWKIHLGEPLPLTQLDPNTKEYWVRVRKMGINKEKYLDSLQRHKTVHK